MRCLEDEHRRIVAEKEDLVQEHDGCYCPQLTVQRVLSSTSFGWHFDREMVARVRAAEHRQTWTSPTFTIGDAQIMMECTPNALSQDADADDDDGDHGGHLLLWITMKGAVDLLVNVESPQIGFECTAEIEGLGHRFQSVSVGKPVPHRMLEHLDDDGLYFICSVSVNDE